MSVSKRSASVVSPIVLKTGQTYTDSTSGQVIIGDGGSNETVVLAAGAWSTTVSIVNRINLAGSIFDYAFVGLGTAEKVYSAAWNISANITPVSAGTTLSFADGSTVTLSLKNSAVQFHIGVLQMTAYATVTLPNGDIAVHGAAAGHDAIVIKAGQHNVVVDDKVSSVGILGDRFESAVLTGKNGHLTISDIGGMVADLAIGAGHTETLNFQNASGTVSLDASGNGLFSLASISLAAKETFTATTSGISIHGAAGKGDVVVLAQGVTGERIDANVGQIDLAGKSSDYSFENIHGALAVFDASNNTVATIQLPTARGASGTQLQFSDGTYGASLGSDGSIALGSTVISSTSHTALGASSPTTSAGSTGTTSATPSFNFSLTLGDFGSYQSAIQSDLTAALNNIGKYLNALGTFHVQVLPETTSGNILAEASGAMVSTPSSLLSAEHGATMSTEFEVTALTGSDANGSAPDATVYINMANIARMNLNANTAPGAGQYDLTSILTHEVLHAIGFTGYLGSGSSSKSAFDSFVVFQNGNPYFTGANAEAVYGGAVPLAPASAGEGSAYYHVAVAGDLMSTSIGAGQVRTVSALDLAILKDIGVPEVTLTGVTSAVHAA